MEDADNKTSAVAEKVARTPIPTTDEILPGPQSFSGEHDAPYDGPYKMYKRRYAGLLGFVMLNIVAAMGWPWFGPISNESALEFGISLDQVNWLGNVFALIYLPSAILIPIITRRLGIRRCCDIGAVALLFAAWIRYAGTARSLSSRGAYVLLIVGQLLSAIAQPIYQVLGPKYSETWFDLKSRTTATMIIAISNPVGGAIGQLLSPLVGTPRQSVLVLAIITTVVIPSVLLIGKAPPIPPTYSGSMTNPPFVSLIRAMLGTETNPVFRMTGRERADFAILMVVFGVIVAGTTSFSIITAQWFEPFGYSEDTSGFLGACLLLTGIVAAIVTAPLFDRVFTHHLAVTSKILVPIIGAAWLSLIWAVKPHNTGGLFAIMTIIGISSVTMLPVGLELACELTRNASGSSAVLWFFGNLLGFIFILVEGALRAGLDGHPPLNMHRAIMFNGIFIFVAAFSILLLKGDMARKSMDEEKSHQHNTIISSNETDTQSISNV